MRQKIDPKMRADVIDIVPRTLFVALSLVVCWAIWHRIISKLHRVCPTKESIL